LNSFGEIAERARETERESEGDGEIGGWKAGERIYVCLINKEERQA
jgi:hypothetical protein